MFQVILQFTSYPIRERESDAHVDTDKISGEIGNLDLRIWGYLRSFRI